ncbi:MAG: hypothetical protein V4561_10480 [Bacteroidota bacterium]
MNTHSFEVAIFSIKLKEFNMMNIYKLIPDFNLKSLKIKISVLFNYDKDLYVNPKVAYAHKGADGELVEILNIHAEMKFGIKTDDPNVIFSEKSINIPDDMAKILLSTSFSTLRGMLAMKTENTFLEDYPLPLITSDELLKRTGLNDFFKKEDSLPPAKQSNKKKAILKTTKKSVKK